MVINETKSRNKKTERCVEKMHTQKKEENQDRLEEQKDKEEETMNRWREESNRMRQIIKEHEEGMARD